MERASHVTSQSEAVFETGDRFEVSVDPRRDCLVLPSVAWPVLKSIDVLQDPGGHQLQIKTEPSTGGLKVRGLRALLPQRWSATWLEYVDQGRYCLRIEPLSEQVTQQTSLTTEQGVSIDLDPQDWSLLCGSARRSVGLEQFRLGLRAARLSTHGGFDHLICLPLVREMELLEHQIRTAKTVLRRFRGRALLADEVGLGKTIEAGLVLSELHTRGLVRSVLVLTPPSLVEQWQGELRRKFSLDFTAYDDPAFREHGEQAWNAFDHLIVSVHTAKRDPHRSAILQRKWDMVIIDEAHHLRNRNTQLWRFASELQKQFILLLTATPVQNNLDELFNLVTLLEPGLLSTSKQFQKRFVDRNDKLTPRNVDELHSLLSEVMVRNRRSTVGLQFTRRWARTERVALSTGERQLYNEVTDFVRQRLRSEQRAAGLNRMVLLTLQMTLGSSSQAAAGTLQRLSQQQRLPAEDRDQLSHLAERVAAETDSSKVQRLLELLKQFRDKMVIFTQFRATQDMLYERLVEAGHEVVMFHGGLSRMEKEAVIQQFRGPARLLLCTESGSEGRNLQFAHGICNFDLPWNPMKIEQRIGRLSRIGQTHDVHVFNLVAAGTVEDAVLHLLEAKLSMFELVIGEIDMILGNLEDEREFQDVVADLWTESADEDDFMARMETLGNRLLAAKEAYLQQRSHDDRLFGNHFAPER